MVAATLVEIEIDYVIHNDKGLHDLKREVQDNIIPYLKSKWCIFRYIFIMSVEALKEKFVPQYMATGEPKFYRLLLLIALNKLVCISKGTYKGTSPEVEFLDYYDQFIILYRREGEEVYLDLARVFRRAGHKIYRIMLKKKMTERNPRFLNLV